MKLGLFLLGLVCLLHASYGCDQLVQSALQFRNFARNTTSQYGYKNNVRRFLNSFALNIEDDQEIREFLCYMVDNNVQTISDMWQYTTGTRGTKAEVAMGYMHFMTHFNHALEQDTRKLNKAQKQKNFLDEVGYPDFPLKKSPSEIAEVVAKTDEGSLRDLFPELIVYENIAHGIFDSQKLIIALSGSESMLDFAQAIYTWKVYSGDELTSNMQVKFRKAEENALSVKMHETLKSTMEQYGFTAITRGGPQKFSCDSLADEALILVAKIKKLVGDYVNNPRHPLYNQIPPLVLTLDDEVIRLYICQFFYMKSVKDLPSFIRKYDYYQVSLMIMDTFNSQDKVIEYVNKVLKAVIWAEQTGFPDFPLNVTETQARELVETLERDRDLSDSAQKEKLVKAIMESKTLAEFRKLPRSSDINNEQVVSVVNLLKGKVELFETIYFDLVRFVACVEEYGLFMLQE